MLNDLRKAYVQDAGLNNIIQSDLFVSTLTTLRSAAAKLCCIAIQAGEPVAAFAASLNYFDAYCKGQLPVNLVQAQRDLFGAHTYERIDATGTFHTDWK